VECRDAILAPADGGGHRQAPWPRADFIVGNAPFVGNKAMRRALGDDYVEALRGAYPDALRGADLSMFWWNRAAVEVAAGRTIRMGMITTSSIVQRLNRKVVAAAAASGADVVWAVANHPWTPTGCDAAVRIAMTVVGRTSGDATRVEVDRDGNVVQVIRAARLNPDLSTGPDVSSVAATPLPANSGLAFQGIHIPKDLVLSEEGARRIAGTDSTGADEGPTLLERQGRHRPPPRHARPRPDGKRKRG
jgi:hypothetical protein